MKLVRTVDAVGHVICHDITVIVKDEKKGAAFKKGHVVREQDIPELMKLGKEHLYIWEKQEGMLHENEAAAILFSLCRGENIIGSEVREGKIECIAAADGLLWVDREKLLAVNSMDDVMIATRHGGFPVKKGDRLAGTRVIPLLISKEKMDAAKAAAGDQPLMRVIPYKPMKAGIVTTGSEVFYGRIQDTFTPVIRLKLSELGIEVIGHETVPDEKRDIARAIFKMLDMGAQMVLCTGGMSVDPDDRTPAAIRDTGADIITYGAPVLPGAMLLLSYYNGEIPILGLPGCVMYAKRTVFDLVLPRIAAGLKVSKREIAELGHGGFCLGCTECAYPNCGFGK